MKRSRRLEVLQSPKGVLEVRCYEPAAAKSYRSWQVLLAEARALAEWWETSGRHIRRRDLPIRSLRVGDILVSMIALETIDLRGLDARGRPNSPLKKPS